MALPFFFVLWMRRQKLLVAAVRWGRRVSRAANMRRQRILALLKYRNAAVIGPVRGTFSDGALLKQGVIKGRLALDSQPVHPQIKGSMTDLAGMHQEGVQPWPVFWTHHRNAHLIGPTLVHINENKEASYEALYGRSDPWRGDPGWSFIFTPEATSLTGNWTSLMSRWSNGTNYYHWFLDALTRLYFLAEFPSDTRILVFGPLRQFQRDSLEMLGVLDRVRETRETHLVIESYYFSAPQAMTGNPNPLGTHFLREKFLPFIIPEGECSLPKKFYVTRSRAPERKILNEKKLIEWFTGEGWAIVELEGMSLREQITLFSRAEAFCGPHGAAFTNLLWCQPGCKVLELFPATYLNACYEVLARDVGCDYRFLVFPSDATHRAIVDLEEVKGEIKKWAVTA